MDLRQMQSEVYVNNVAHGWYEDERSFGDDVSLLHTEVSEAFEAYRVAGLEDQTRAPKQGWLDRLLRRPVPLPKPEGVGSELADVLIRLLDTADRTGIDLEFEFARKMAYNHTRPYKHGKRL